MRSLFPFVETLSVSVVGMRFGIRRLWRISLVRASQVCECFGLNIVSISIALGEYTDVFEAIVIEFKFVSCRRFISI
jgi:hypothetical protein